MIDYTKDILTPEEISMVAIAISQRLNAEQPGQRSQGVRIKHIQKAIKAQQKKLRKKMEASR